MTEPTVTDEAVEVASKAVARTLVGMVYMSAVDDAVTKGEMRDALDTAARAALEAALPLIVDDLRANPRDEKEIQHADT